MSLQELEIKENFAKNLKAKAYNAEMILFWSEQPHLFRFMLMSTHEVFSSGRFSGSKLLEIGSGATIHGIASASAHFDSIVMSDFVEDNLEELNRWLRGDSPFRQLLEVQAGLEGYGNDLVKGTNIIEARIRKKVKRVTRCDLLTDNILLVENDDPETSPPFDAVVSYLCLECVPEDVRSYTALLMRINKLLRPGGGILICGYLHGNLWKVDERFYHYVKLSESEVVTALRNAGFEKIELKTIDAAEGERNYYNYEKMFCVVANKSVGSGKPHVSESDVSPTLTRTA